MLDGADLHPHNALFQGRSKQALQYQQISGEDEYHDVAEIERSHHSAGRVERERDRAAQRDRAYLLLIGDLQPEVVDKAEDGADASACDVEIGWEPELVWIHDDRRACRVAH